MYYCQGQPTKPFAKDPAKKKIISTSDNTLAGNSDVAEESGAKRAQKHAQLPGPRTGLSPILQISLGRFPSDPGTAKSKSKALAPRSASVDSLGSDGGMSEKGEISRIQTYHVTVVMG